jgi:hypothetical protein
MDIEKQLLAPIQTPFALSIAAGRRYFGGDHCR